MADPGYDMPSPGPSIEPANLAPGDPLATTPSDPSRANAPDPGRSSRTSSNSPPLNSEPFKGATPSNPSGGEGSARIVGSGRPSNTSATAASLQTIPGSFARPASPGADTRPLGLAYSDPPDLFRGPDRLGREAGFDTITTPFRKPASLEDLQHPTPRLQRGMMPQDYADTGPTHPAHPRKLVDVSSGLRSGAEATATGRPSLGGGSFSKLVSSRASIRSTSSRNNLARHAAPPASHSFTGARVSGEGAYPLEPKRKSESKRRSHPHQPILRPLYGSGGESPTTGRGLTGRSEYSLKLRAATPAHGDSRDEGYEYLTAEDKRRLDARWRTEDEVRRELVRQEEEEAARQQYLEDVVHEEPVFYTFGHEMSTGIQGSDLGGAAMSDDEATEAPADDELEEGNGNSKDGGIPAYHILESGYSGDGREEGHHSVKLTAVSSERAAVQQSLFRWM